MHDTFDAKLTGPLASTPESTPVLLEPYAVEKLPAYGYVQEEYLASGVACSHPYTTRVLIRRPASPARYNGRWLTEVSHIWGGTSVWRAYHRELMRDGFIWMEIDSQAPSALGLVRDAAPQRYAAMKMQHTELAREFKATIPFTDGADQQTLATEYDQFMQRWWSSTPQSFDIIAQVAAAVRKGLPRLPETAARTLLLAGISQTGGVTRRFVTDHHAAQSARLGHAVFDGYLPGASGGDALPDIEVPVMEILGESEMQSVRRPCRVSGQVRGLSHRREDSATFRLYEVAGMAHRETRYMSEKDVQRLRSCPLPEGGRWSSFPNSHVYSGMLQLMVRWVEEGHSPPPSRVLKTEQGTAELMRDQWGNALGGLRTHFTDIPRHQLIAATPVGRPSWYHGSEVPFNTDTLRRLYSNADQYRFRANEQIERAMAEGFLRPADAEAQREELLSVTF